MNAIAVLLQKLQGRRVYFDTNTIIYFLEQHQPYFSVMAPIFDMVGTGDVDALTGNITLAETLIKPLRDKNNVLVQDIKSLLLDPDIFTLIELPRATFIQAAELGGKAGLRLADALHFACAIDASCQYFLTNDRRFVSSHGVEVIPLADLT